MFSFKTEVTTHGRGHTIDLFMFKGSSSWGKQTVRPTLSPIGGRPVLSSGHGHGHVIDYYLDMCIASVSFDGMQ
jgi:hypothetical protein